jgi:methyl-accepting chemotaxis protein
VARAVGGGAAGTEVRRFEGATFEEALRQAAAMGALKPSCVDKQIAFLVRSLPDGGTGVAAGGGEGAEPADRREGRVGAVTAALFPAVAQSLSALIHEIQRERGRSALFVSSAGRLFGRELVDQWRLTDERRAELASFRERHAGRLPEAAGQGLERADELLGKLVPGRKRVEALEMAAPRIIEAYTAVNAELLAVSDVLVAEGVERTLRPTAIAWTALLNAKEKVGIERAELASAFAFDRSSDETHLTVAALIAARRAYLHIVSVAAPKRTVRLLERSLASEAASTLERVEQLALGRRSGFGVDPLDWFTIATRKMDLLGDIESTMLQGV